MASLAACCACQGLTCLSNSACSCFGQVTNKSNKLARLSYTAIFFIVSLSSWAWYVGGYDWYKNNFPHSIIHINCPEEKCFGAMSVYRFTAVLTCFFMIHAIIAATCNSNKFNSKWWGLKLILLAGSLIVSLFIPNSIFYVWAWISLIGGVIFIIVQLILLVEFAHSWSESWVKKWDEDPENAKWFYGLIAASISLYIVSFCLTIAEYRLFTNGSMCRINSLFISINSVLIVLGTAISLHPQVQEKNPNSGLLQSAVIAAYTTYLTWSAFTSHPKCDTMITDINQSVSAITGTILIFVSVCYSAFRVSTKAEFMSLDRSSQDIVNNVVADIENTSKEEDNIDDSIVHSTKTRLINTINTINTTKNREDDTGFNYVFFHICFTLASCYIAMLITNWMIVKKVPEDMENSHYVIGKSISSMWVKISSSWVAHLLYMWSLIAPILLPYRVFYDTR